MPCILKNKQQLPVVVLAVVFSALLLPLRQQRGEALPAARVAQTGPIIDNRILGPFGSEHPTSYCADWSATWGEKCWHYDEASSPCQIVNGRSSCPAIDYNVGAGQTAGVSAYFRDYVYAGALSYKISAVNPTVQGRSGCSYVKVQLVPHDEPFNVIAEEHYLHVDPSPSLPATGRLMDLPAGPSYLPLGTVSASQDTTHCGCPDINGSCDWDGAHVHQSGDATRPIMYHNSPLPVVPADQYSACPPAPGNYCVNSGGQQQNYEAQNWWVHAATGSLTYLMDANADGSVNSTDTLCILRYVAGLDLSGACDHSKLAAHGDTNGNGQISAVDALCVLRYAVDFAGTYNCPQAQTGQRSYTATRAMPVVQATPSPVRPARTRAGSPKPATAVTPMDSSYLQFSLTPGSANLSYGQTATFTIQANIPAGVTLGAWTIDVSFWAPYTTATSCYSSLSACNWSFDSQDVRFANSSTSGLSGSVTPGTVTLDDTDVPGWQDPVFVLIRELADPTGNPLAGGGGLGSWINTQ
ncbi:MAG: dockerin type I repeat-containing protein [Dehalococcoidia bacterium]